MRKSTKLIILSFLTICFILSNKPQGASTVNNDRLFLWTEHKQSPNIFDIAIDEDYVWGAHSEGAIRWNKGNHSFTHFTQADGLIDSNVTAIEIDNDGNVWFGTPSGLSYYDGNSWTQFNSSNGLTHNHVLSLSLGSNGEMLVGTSGGLSIFDGTNWEQFIDEPITDPNGCLYYGGGVSDAEIADNGYIWISTSQGAACYFNGSIWILLTKDGQGINAEQIEFSNNGDLWLAGVYHQNENGVMQYKSDGTWNHYTKDNGLLDDDTTSLAIDDNGGVWVGVNGPYGHGVSYFNGTTWTSHSKPTGYYGGGVYAIEADKNNNIWTGNVFNVSQFDGSSWQAYLAGPPGGFVYEMTFDHNDHLWASLYRNGVVKYDGQAWIHFTPADGLPGENVADIFIDSVGTIWFASYTEEFSQVGQGLTKFDGITWQTFTTDDGLASNSIQNIAEDSNGNLWIAHRYGSVDKWDGQSWMNYSTSDGLLYERVSIIYAQGDTLWFAHSGDYAFESGVSQFDGAVWSTFENELLFSKVNNFTTDSSGKLFALAYYDGVNIFETNTWSGEVFPDVTQFDPPGYDFTARDFVFDKDGILWIVGNQDLLLFDGADWALYTEENTSVSRLVEDIAIDSTGNNIWLDSSAGLVNVQVFDIARQIFLPFIQK